MEAFLPGRNWGRASNARTLNGVCDRICDPIFPPVIICLFQVSERTNARLAQRSDQGDGGDKVQLSDNDALLANSNKTWKYHLCCKNRKYICYLQESSPAVLPRPAGSGVKCWIACPGFWLPRREGQPILVTMKYDQNYDYRNRDNGWIIKTRGWRIFMSTVELYA